MVILYNTIRKRRQQPMKYTRELARIKAVQKHYEYAHYGRPTQRPTPVSFDQWFLQGIRKYEAKSAEFELMPGMVKICWPGKVPMLRTVEDFEREYKTAHLKQEVEA
ncbi:MAG TPA: hypothetical protein VIL99_10735 [Ignavibacteria bacterium]